DVVDLGGGQARLGQAVVDGVAGETVVVLGAGEALLLGGGHDLAVHHQGGGGVVVEGRDPEDGGHLSIIPCSSPQVGGQPGGEEVGQAPVAALVQVPVIGEAVGLLVGPQGLVGPGDLDTGGGQRLLVEAGQVGPVDE